MLYLAGTRQPAEPTIETHAPFGAYHGYQFHHPAATTTPTAGNVASATFPAALLFTN